MIKRITILGGSSVYIPEFIMSLISHNLNVREIVLYGRESEKLDVVSEFCQRLVRRTGYPGEVHKETNLESAVKDATYILNNIRVGGLKARMRDESLPPLMDMVGDDGVGAGGFSNALRTVPVVLDIAERISAVNKDALFINLTNPVGIVMQALIQRTELNAVGIVDMPASIMRTIAERLRLPVNELDFDFIGLDRLGWIQDIHADGKSVMGKAVASLLEHPADALDSEVIEIFRMIPTRSISLYFHREEVLKRQKSQTRARANVLYEAEKQILDLYRDPGLHEIPELTRARNAVWFEETIVPLFSNLESKDKGNVILSMRNDGAIRDLPDVASVEIPASVSKKGIEPRKVGDCPHFLKGLFAMVKESDRMVVEAIQHRSYDLALQSLAMNPFVPSLEKARNYLNRALEEEGVELH